MRVLWRTVVVVLALAVGVGVASATVFSNTTPIVINSSATPQAASPYPSTISVSGFSGAISDVNVSLRNLSHTFPDDVDVLLVGPGGQTVFLMGDAGSDQAASNVTLTIDSQAANQIPCDGLLSSGTYRPANCPEDPNGCGFESDTFPAPAPAAPYGTSLSVFNSLSGANVNGVWSLYVVDDCQLFTGAMNGGWSLDILGSPTVARLRSFTAEHARQGTELRWRTSTETDLLGFNVYRETGATRTRVNPRLIPASAHVGEATYRFVDRAPGRADGYRLEAVSRDGSRSSLAVTRSAPRTR